MVNLFQDGPEGPEVTAAFALADVIRANSKEVVDRLHEMEIGVAMLTGDSKAVAKSVAEELALKHTLRRY